MLRKIIAVIFLALTLALSACHTMSGLGQDIKAGGQAIENAAKKQ